MCSGVTMFDPLIHWGAYESDKEMSIGIIGIGGLGTMGIKLAKAMGHRVVAISNSPHKEPMARERGASSFVCATNQDSMNKEAGKLDLILNTVSAPHQVAHYIPLLKAEGTIVQLGLVPKPHELK